MATNANNVIIRDFAKRLRSFVMDVFQLNKREAYVILNGVFAETFRGADSEMVDPAVIEPIIIGLCDQIPRTPKNTIDWDARELLPISSQSLIQIERSNEESKDKEGYREQQRTFSLLPTKKGFEANYCKIDSARLDHSNPRSNREIDKVPRIRQLLRATTTKKTSNLTSLLNPIEFALEHPFSADSSFVDLLLKQVNWTALRRKAWHKSIIGFGNCGACGNSVSKKSPAGLVKVLASKLARYCAVVVVDEHRTSRVHHDCEASVDLKNQTVKRVCKDGVVRRVKVHRVLHCVALEGGCGKTVERDANAAKSILSVLLCQLSGDPERPERLRHQSHPAKDQPPNHCRVTQRVITFFRGERLE